ncbi:MAG: GNAT family N-acetyltransferase [Fimbriimonadaceae bacterium]|nr:GNAT family N-acetyltransferase [Fimbriimonadaceae bacterium]
MSVAFREIAENEAQGLVHVWSVVYNRGEAFTDEAGLFKGRLAFIGEDDGRPVAGYTVVPMRTTRGAGVVPCAGIAGVGVLPEARHGQVGTAMMKWSLRDLRERGFELAALYAFSDQFYRRVGYEVAGRRFQIQCPAQRLPRLTPSLPIRQIAPTDAHLLDGCYQAFAKAHSGLNLRTKEQWTERFGQRPPMIYAAGDPVEAYAWVSMEGGFWDDLRVGEFVWSSRRGYESILATLTGLCINRSNLIWYEPSDSPFLCRFMDQGIKVSLERHAMFRVLEVPRALSRLFSEGSGEFSFRVEDADLPENVGPWRVRYGADGVEVQPCSEPELVFTSQTFAQAFMGEPSLETLLHNGNVTSTSDRAALDACRLMTPRATVCMDFF